MSTLVNITAVVDNVSDAQLQALASTLGLYTVVNATVQQNFSGDLAQYIDTPPTLQATLFTVDPTDASVKQLFNNGLKDLGQNLPVATN